MNNFSFEHFLFYYARIICKNTVFHWPAFSLIKTEPMILSLYGKIFIRENTGQWKPAFSLILYSVSSFIYLFYDKRLLVLLLLSLLLLLILLQVSLVHVLILNALNF